MKDRFNFRIASPIISLDMVLHLIQMMTDADKKKLAEMIVNAIEVYNYSEPVGVAYEKDGAIVQDYNDYTDVVYQARNGEVTRKSVLKSSTPMVIFQQEATKPRKRKAK